MAPKTYSLARKHLVKQIVHFHAAALQAVAEDQQNKQCEEAKIFLLPGSDFMAHDDDDEEDHDYLLDTSSATGERKILRIFLHEQLQGGDFLSGSIMNCFAVDSTTSCCHL